MVITIDTTNVNFADGSSFSGNYSSPITPDTNTSEFTSAYNIGTLLLSVNFFYAGNNPAGPGGSPLTSWNLNNNATNNGNATPVAASQYYGETSSTPYLDPKMVFSNGGSGIALAGTWRGRGNPLNRGAQGFLNVTMIERVA